MIQLTPLAWALSCTTALLLCACGAEPVRPLRIGVNPWPGYESLSLAAVLDLYHAGPGSVEIVELYSLEDARRTFERGDLDGFCGTLVELAEARENSDRQPRVVIVPDSSEGADVVLGRVPDISALRGKRVAVEADSLPLYVLARALNRAGIEFDEVELVPMDALRMVRAMEDFEVDAVVAYPPTSLRIIAQPGVNTLFSTAEIPGEVIDVVMVDASVIEARPADVQNLVRGWERAMAYVASHPQQAFAIMADREGLTVEQFADAFQNGMRVLGPEHQAAYLGPNGSLPGILDGVIEVMRDVGELQGDFSPSDLATAGLQLEFTGDQ